jgi:hypothetical protein
LLLGLLLAGAQAARGQATTTASKTMDVSGFGGYEYVSPDFRSSPQLSGFVFGANITRYFHFPIAPSLEGRFNYANGPAYSERTYLGGVRAQGKLGRRFYPYGDFLIGSGTIHFNQIFIPGYTKDTSLTKSIGGGVDIDLVSHFQAKIDYQQQFWKIGTEVANFSPSLFSVSVVYRIPFRTLNTQSDYHH